MISRDGIRGGGAHATIAMNPEQAHETAGLGPEAIGSQDPSSVRKNGNHNSWLNKNPEGFEFAWLAEKNIAEEQTYHPEVHLRQLSIVGTIQDADYLLDGKHPAIDHTLPDSRAKMHVLPSGQIEFEKE